MKIIDNFLFKALLKNTILVLIVLILIFSGFQFIHELQYIGVNQYDLGSSIIYLILKTPLYLSMMSSIALIIGSIITVSDLKSENEILPIYFSGMSKKQISRKFFYFLTFALLIFFFINEVANFSSIKAEILRAKKLEIESPVTKNSSDYWLKRNNEIINVSPMQTNDNLHSIKIFELNKKNTLSGYKSYQAEGEKFLAQPGLIFKPLKDKHHIDIMENKNLTNFELKNLPLISPSYLTMIDLMKSLLVKRDAKTVNEIQNRILTPIVTLMVCFLAIIFSLKKNNFFSLTRQITIGVILSVLAFYLIRLMSLFTKLEILSIYPLITLIVVSILLSMLIYTRL